MEFPADQAWNSVAVLHAGAFENPVTGVRHDPIARTIERGNRARTDQHRLVRAVSREWLHVRFFCLIDASKPSSPHDDPVWNAGSAVCIRRNEADCVAR